MLFGKYQIDQTTLYRILLWLGITLIFSFLTLSPSYENWAGAFGAMHGAIGMVGNLFVIGLPFSLGVALVFTTSSAHRKFVQKTPDVNNIVKSLFIRYLFLLLIFSLYVAFATIAAFSIRANEYPHVNPVDIYKYFPGVVLSGITITSLLISLLLPIVLAVDDWRYGAILGSGFLYGLGVTFGVSAYNLHDLSLFSPFHLYRFLALALSGDVVCPTMGQIWGDPDRMHMIMELYVDWVGLLGPLITYGIIALFAFILSVRIFMSHHSFWVYESRYTENWTGAKKGISELSEDHIPSGENDRNRKILKRHRQIVAAFILVLIIGGPILMLSYARQRQSELTYVLYENSGKVIVLGEYYYGEVDVPEPPLGMNNMYQLETIILDWSNCPEPLDRWSGFREMTLDEFTALNVSEREDLVSSGSHSIKRDNPSTGGGWSGLSGSESGIFVWFFKYNCTKQSACSITVSIKVSVQSM